MLNPTLIPLSDDGAIIMGVMVTFERPTVRQDLPNLGCGFQDLKLIDDRI